LSIYLFLGKWDEADGVVKEAAEKDPNYAQTLINQIMVCFRAYVDFRKKNRFKFQAGLKTVNLGFYTNGV
jgi:hypothetical protein